MKMTPELRKVLEKHKRGSSVYSDMMIYGAVQLGTGEYRPKVSRAARVELNASGSPAALAKILERYAAKKSVTGAMLDVICVAIADGVGDASGKQVDGVIAAAAALQKLFARRRTLPMFGEDAISAVVDYWLASKRKPAKLTAILEQLIPDEVIHEPLASRVAAFRKATTSKAPKRSR
jgi:hypothetical protein